MDRSLPGFVGTKRPLIDLFLIYVVKRGQRCSLWLNFLINKRRLKLNEAWELWERGKLKIIRSANFAPQSDFKKIILFFFQSDFYGEIDSSTIGNCVSVPLFPSSPGL